MSIVCGVDFAELDRAALLAAGALAACTREEIVYLVHVLAVNVMTPLTIEQQARTRADVVERLASDALELSKRFGLAHVHPTVLVGTPSDALIEFATFNGASWLVVASQGHPDSPLYRIDGTSERVATDSQIPVLVARFGALRGLGAG